MAINTLQTRTGQELETAAIHLVARDGVDHVSVAAVCEIAGISRPTFYSRFGNLDGLYADIWLKKFSEYFHELETSKDIESDFLIGMTRLFAVSRRMPELSDMVQFTARAWWQRRSAVSNDAGLSWLISSRIGLILTSHISPIRPTLWAVDEALRTISNRALPERKTSFEVIELSPIKLEDDFLDAAFVVLAASGYENASLSRIARSFRVTTGSIYPKFKNKEELIFAVFEQAQGRVVKSNKKLVFDRGLSPMAAEAFIRGGLADNRARWRNLRLEALLASSINDDFQDSVRKSISAVEHELVPVMQQAGVSNNLARAVGYTFHTLAVGFSVLHAAGLNVCDLNHMGVASALLAKVSGQSS